MVLATPSQDRDRSAAAARRTRPLDILFRAYKIAVSPVLHALSPSRCVYLPTCSEYAYLAVARFGAVRGSWMALRRLARCHPWARGGLDPVPELGPEATTENQPGASRVPEKSAASGSADRLP